MSDQVVTPTSATSYATAQGGTADVVDGEAGPTQIALPDTAGGVAAVPASHFVVRVHPAVAGATGRANGSSVSAITPVIHPRAGLPTVHRTTVADAPVRTAPRVTSSPAPVQHNAAHVGIPVSA